MSYLDHRTVRHRPDAGFDSDVSWTSNTDEATRVGSLSRGVMWALVIAVSFWALLAVTIWLL